jgi:molybdopterin-containing oxidoreductase family iron-sulfur binding subunit
MNLTSIREFEEQSASPVKFWRSLEELAGDPEFEARLGREFERLASIMDPVTDRRKFVQLLAASMALATMNGCSSPPPEPIMPYVHSPEGITQGIPVYQATAMPCVRGALGLVATNDMGRPTKVEGNPLHPASLGATDTQAQASILGLYDPDRSQTVKRYGEITTWDAFVNFARQTFRDADTNLRLRVLSHPVSSPTTLRQRDALLAKFPSARWHEYNPADGGAAQAGAELAFGERISPVYRLAKADVVVAIGADFLCDSGGGVRYARDFMARRDDGANANRFYAIESTLSSTGAAADHRLPLAPSECALFVQALAARLGIGEPSENSHQKWVDAVAEDLERHRGRSAVIVGDSLPAKVHALAHVINSALGNLGATIEFIDPIAPGVGNGFGLEELVESLNADQVDALLILDCNPVYDAPQEFKFSDALAKAKHSLHWGLYVDESAERCVWHIPATHYLESWDDTRGYDGTAAIVQPLIAPLYGGRTVAEVLSVLIDETPLKAYELVRTTWQSQMGDGFEAAWHEALANGLVADSQFAPRTPNLQASSISFPEESTSAEDDRFQVLLVPDPNVGDGRFANNGWLQELPKPFSKLTWENAVLMSPDDAAQLGCSTGDVVRIEIEGRDIEGPVCIQPGHASGCVTCYLGYGRERAGNVGTGLGFNAYRLCASTNESVLDGARITKTSAFTELAITQKHHAIDGRNIVHSRTLEDYLANPEGEGSHGHHELLSLLPEVEYPRFAWGMAIDLTKCMGCNACVTACQAENNIPIVGKEQVIRSREMHWLRLDVYYSGEPANPEVITQPMLCQHCEKAPCEVVCPVAATTHSDDGLNEMTYNRCIGTRYCSNNCPYKVRRFNFFDYQSEEEVLKLQKNPRVTVRSRGVMEKCTYCVQRINLARIAAKKDSVDDGGPLAIANGSLQTACQQACPTQAIVFGDINDPESRVAKLKQDPRNYGVLEELGTQPRTTYLTRLRNLNPALT